MHNNTYCTSLSSYSRLQTKTVLIGDVPLGSDYPIRLQSMTNTKTLNTAATVEQSIKMIKAGCDYVRITAASIQEAENLIAIKKELRNKGYNTPIIADVHFNPTVAEIAAQLVEKVRINPGNYIDKRTEKKIDFTNAEYAGEIERIHTRIKPLIEICKQHGTALRIGSNHGSLSDRILSRYGNTPLGMVEAAMEFIRICEDLDFRNLVISMKSSNTKVMVQSTRLLVNKMLHENMHYPLHLGVTEAGEGEDGRIRSAAGIGTLLADGLGDTIRVSLSESPEHELPVAKMLAERFLKKMHSITSTQINDYAINPFTYSKRKSIAIAGIGGDNHCITGAELNTLQHKIAINTKTINSTTDIDSIALHDIVLIQSNDTTPVTDIRVLMNIIMQKELNNPVIIKRTYSTTIKEELKLHASTDFGLLLMDGLCDGIQIESSLLPKEELNQLELSILQATGIRISRTEFISCPTCGRTQFDLPTAVADVKAKTSHLKGLKIAVMGCIVNGPGEMADADYGYVGAGASKVTLYKKQVPVIKNIPEHEAVEALIALIKDNGDWR